MSAPQKKPSPPLQRPSLLRRLLRFTGATFLGLLALFFSVAVCVAIAMTSIYPNLPDLSTFESNYKPKLPLRIFSADGVLIGEYADERRSLTPLNEMPDDLINALLAVEDKRFFEHHGIDPKGLARAVVANLKKLRSEGASTITMQVARNVYLSSERKFIRKLYEVTLALELERNLSKEQILEIYMNHVNLGNRSHGFAAASKTYFGKPLAQLTLAEAAMLAGLPKAPGASNPIRNFRKAKERQEHVLRRMISSGFITQAEADAAKAEVIQVKGDARQLPAEFGYIAETARQLVCQQYGNACYSRGIHVYTTVRSTEQQAATDAVRSALMKFDRSRRYRGPEAHITIPNDPEEAEGLFDRTLNDYPDSGEILSAIVLNATPKKVTVRQRSGDTLEITGKGLRRVRFFLTEKAGIKQRIVRGAVIRITQNSKKQWIITQLPVVQSALIAMNPRTGSIQAMVGGFDFRLKKFNRVTQAYRQPGSCFKPFIYSASLEHGISGATIVNDSPLFFSARQTGGQPWEPKNYSGRFSGPIPMRTALAKSVNIASIRILDEIGTHEGQQWAMRFGFEEEKNPAFLTLALGAGEVTPMQLAVGYSVFANGGHLIQPQLIQKVTDSEGRPIAPAITPPVLDDSNRVIDARNAFIMTSLLQEVTRRGTASRASRTLKRNDIYGKTGTTNDARDAWFAGWQKDTVAVTWLGYDQPSPLGRRATGGGISMPIWVDYMRTVLKDRPVSHYKAPKGVVKRQGEWYYTEYAGGRSVASLGMEDYVDPELDWYEQLNPQVGTGPLDHLPPGTFLPPGYVPPENQQAQPPQQQPTRQLTPAERRELMDLFSN